MLLAQINRSPDLKQLVDEGFEIEVKGGHLIVHHIPYVNSSREIKYGTLITALSLNNPESFETAESFLVAISRYTFQSFFAKKNRQKRISTSIGARPIRFL